MPTIEESALDADRLREEFEALTPRVIELKEAADRVAFDVMTQIAAHGFDSPDSLRAIIRGMRAAADSSTIQLEFMTKYANWLAAKCDIAERCVAEVVRQPKPDCQLPSEGQI